MDNVISSKPLAGASSVSQSDSSVNGTEVSAPDSDATSVAPPRPACFFSLGGELFAIEGSWAREVAVIRGATSVPRTASFVLGVGNLRGRVLPLVDLNPMMGLKPRPASEEYLALVTQVGDRWAGMVIDEVLRFGFFMDSSLKPVHEAETAFPKRFLLGWLHLVGRPVQLVDARRLISELGAEGVVSGTSASRQPAPFEPLGEPDSSVFSSGLRTV